MPPPDRSRTLATLLRRLERRYELVTEAIPIGPLRVQFTRVSDPQKVLDDLCRKIDEYETTTGQRVSGDQLGLPYWAELWDSAIGVGQWLLTESQQWRAAPDPLAPSPSSSQMSPVQPSASHPAVLDLGCGMGLAGTVAALLGAEVMFGDIETECLLFSTLNGLRYNPGVYSRRVDWQRDDLGQRFDLIIGSDVLYDKTQWTYLEPFFRRHLAPAGRVILGEPGRQTGDLFIDWIAGRGWSLQRHTETVPTRTVPIRLFELKHLDPR